MESLQKLLLSMNNTMGFCDFGSRMLVGMKTWPLKLFAPVSEKEKLSQMTAASYQQI
ncbi:hypothetical protein RchiOBHm_Chr6g0279351 [Rosa chinensis]|uniref:Uncharacterized protein n=2 Tax=Rosa chinensis TaxID=74649 RepID=A0A2P6PT02_ROSCH|nr:hypothetical protein RchiOBHm_Chr6g0279351 [Rosa chinensis]